MALAPINLVVDDDLVLNLLDAQAKGAFRRGRITVVMSIASGKVGSTEVLWQADTQADIDAIDVASEFFDAHGDEPAIRVLKGDPNPVVPAEPT